MAFDEPLVVRRLLLWNAMRGGAQRLHDVRRFVLIAMASLLLGGCGVDAAASKSPVTAPSKPIAFPATVATIPQGPITVPTTTTPPGPLFISQMPPSEYAGSSQVIVVTAPSYHSYTGATLTAYQKTTSGWSIAFGPMEAQIGYNGFAAPGKTYEGDGMTPSGSYSFGFFFGIDPAPSGIRFQYVQAPQAGIWCWDENVDSANYNTLQPCSNINPAMPYEDLHTPTAYNYAATINFNTNPVVRGFGSGIFFHVTPGPNTGGCVAINQSSLIQVLQWLDPTQNPVIVMGLTSEVLNGFK